MEERKYLRVDEVIEILNQLPQDLPVYDWSYKPIEGIRETEVCVSEKNQEYRNVAFIY